MARAVDARWLVDDLTVVGRENRDDGDLRVREWLRRVIALFPGRAVAALSEVCCAGRHLQLTLR